MWALVFVSMATAKGELELACLPPRLLEREERGARGCFWLDMQISGRPQNVLKFVASITKFGHADWSVDT